MIEHQLRRRGIVMRPVLDAMRAVPRHLFVAHDYADKAYADEALPSQDGQTISQPYMVAVMTQELQPRPGHRVLELGTGTGYQTAVLAHLVGDRGRVYTVERVPALADLARRRLDAMAVANVRYCVGDGSAGWPASHADPDAPPFDRILVTAAAPDLPRPLLAQLTDGGVMVVPVGPADAQTLLRVDRRGDRFDQTPVLECRFVPLLGAHAWDRHTYEQMHRDHAARTRPSPPETP
jgi:protein-L-isoaspartate(D-aspartate) O-methyltransferase